MIFADKLITLRKKEGWSQEDLAARIAVSRQSVSKWESAQSVPDLEKILKLADLFNVTTDYLLKDDIEDIATHKTAVMDSQTTGLEEENEELTPRYVVSLEDAQAFIAVKAKTSKLIALGVSLCIMAVVPYLLLEGIAEAAMSLGGSTPFEDTAELIGIVLMFAIVALAGALFMHSGSLSSRFHFLGKELIETKYGVTGFAEKRKEAFAPHRSKRLIIGVMLCICAVIPVLVLEVLFGEENEFASIIGVCLMFLMVAVAVYNFVWTEITWVSYEKLLQEASYTPEKKRMKSEHAGFIASYWAKHYKHTR